MEYVKRGNRHAEKIAYRKKEETEENGEYSSLWYIS
jgi:hypothetical protein